MKIEIVFERSEIDALCEEAAAKRCTLPPGFKPVAHTMGYGEVRVTIEQVESTPTKTPADGNEIPQESGHE
jgi:hypothetical protein